MTWKLNERQTPKGNLVSGRMALIFDRDHDAERKARGAATSEKKLAAMEFTDASEALKALRETRQRREAVAARVAELEQYLAEHQAKLDQAIRDNAEDKGKLQTIVDKHKGFVKAQRHELAIVDELLHEQYQAAATEYKQFQLAENAKAGSTAVAKEAEATAKLNELVPPLLEAWAAARHKQLTGQWPTDAEILGANPAIPAVEDPDVPNMNAVRRAGHIGPHVGGEIDVNADTPTPEMTPPELRPGGPPKQMFQPVS